MHARTACASHDRRMASEYRVETTTAADVSTTATGAPSVGDLFGSGRRGAELPGGLAGPTIARAGRAEQDRRGGPELQGARGRAGEAPAARAAHLHQAVDGRDRAGRRDRDSSGRRACRPRGEVGIVIGRRRYRVPAARAADYILGVTCVNDVTAREIQTTRGPLHAAEGVRHVRAGRAVHRPGPGSGRIWPSKAGSTTSCGRPRRTRDLIFPVPELVAFISSVMTLLPGDIISTGTPAGIGPLAPGRHGARDGRRAASADLDATRSQGGDSHEAVRRHRQREGHRGRWPSWASSTASRPTRR